MKLLSVDTVGQVKQKLDNNFSDLKLEIESVNITEALDRVLAEDIYSNIALPEFNRSTVDGYSVVAKDTFGASDSLPVFLEVKGKVEMGQAASFNLKTGEAVYVPTGGMIPEGADSMVMIEYVEELDKLTIAVNTSVAPGDGIIFIGDDIKKGDKLLEKGSTIRAQEIGVLAAVGIEKVKVYKKPRIAVISTGDEIVYPFGAVSLGQVRDINTYLIAAIAEEMGAEVTAKRVMEDDFELLRQTIAELIENNDIVAVSGGSSMGNKDVTAKVIDSLGEPGVLVHGIAIKPGKPTIVGKAKGIALFGLPGHPVSAAIVFKIFGGHLVDNLMGRKARKNLLQAVCEVNIPSAPGKETYQMVDLIMTEEGYTARPIHAKSAAISHLAKSKGFITIPANREGIKKGEMVIVELL